MDTEQKNSTMPFYKNKQLLGATLIALVLLLGAGYFVYSNHYAHGGVVATVDGQKLYRDALEKNMRNMEEGAKQQGMDVSDPTIQEEIRKQSLQMLIDNTLLLNAAAEAGVVATDEEVDETYATLVAEMGGEDVITAELVTLGLTLEELRANIRERVVADNYIEAVTDIEEITVSDEEITAFIEGLNAEELPPIEEIRPQIEEGIKRQKQQEMLTQLIEELRANAVITENK